MVDTFIFREMPISYKLSIATIIGSVWSFIDEKAVFITYCT